MKEQDAAHSLDELIELKEELERTRLLLQNCNGDIIRADRELTSLRSELKNLDTIRKEEFRVLSRENAKLTSELKQERELRKELVNCLEVHQTKLISADHYWGSDTNEWAESLIKKAKAK